MWEEKVRIYGTPEDFNNFPLFHPWRGKLFHPWIFALMTWHNATGPSYVALYGQVSESAKC